MRKLENQNFHKLEHIEKNMTQTNEYLENTKKELIKKRESIRNQNHSL
jgi:hypothetical protein